MPRGLLFSLMLWVWCTKMLHAGAAEEGADFDAKRRRWHAEATLDPSHSRTDQTGSYAERLLKETTETAPRHHHHRPSTAMQHREPLEGLTVSGSVKEGFGLRRPREPPHPDRRRIPKIFHQIYISGEQEYRKICKNPKSLLSCTARDSCLMYLQDWEHHLWNLSSIEAMLEEHYPWTVAMFKAYDHEVKRADMGRAFILHRYGGLYLDIDCECFRDPIDSLTDYDFVIQGSGFEGVNNGMMASAPGLPLWEHVAQILEDRAEPTGDAWKDGPIFMTGPRVLGEVFQQFLDVEIADFWRLGFDGGVFHYEQFVVKVYPLNTWYMPCWISDLECRARFEIPEPEGVPDLTQLVGYHQFASIWGK